jgi:hypothetical protein
MKFTGITILLFIIGICNSALSQDRRYLYLGMEIENFRHLEPLNLIIRDYNDFHNINDLNTTHSFALPGYIQGFSVGAKIHVRFSEFGGNVHFNSFSTTAQGTSSDGTEYYNKIIVSHNGFHIYYRILIINTNYFRTGPGLGFKVEQLKTKLNFTEDPSISTMIPANKALMSCQINYNISVGGPKFNMDIGIFYQIPFWKIDMNGLNTNLNKDFAKTYSTEQMEFNPVLYGISFCIGLGSKDNYDF